MSTASKKSDTPPIVARLIGRLDEFVKARSYIVTDQPTHIATATPERSLPEYESDDIRWERIEQRVTQWREALQSFGNPLKEATHAFMNACRDYRVVAESRVFRTHGSQIAEEGLLAFSNALKGQRPDSLAGKKNESFLLDCSTENHIGRWTADGCESDPFEVRPIAEYCFNSLTESPNPGFRGIVSKLFGRSGSVSIEIATALSQVLLDGIREAGFLLPSFRKSTKRDDNRIEFRLRAAVVALPAGIDDAANPDKGAEAESKLVGRYPVLEESIGAAYSVAFRNTLDEVRVGDEGQQINHINDFRAAAALSDLFQNAAEDESADEELSGLLRDVGLSWRRRKESANRFLGRKLVRTLQNPTLDDAE